MSRQTKRQLADALQMLGRQIKSIREVLKLSQFDFAKVCGLDQAQLSRIEAGKVNLTLSTLLQIANASKLSLDIQFSEL